VITLPCNPPMRVLIDFKNCKTLESSSAYMSTVVMNADVVDAKQKEDGKDGTIEAVMLMYPDDTILPSKWAKNPARDGDEAAGGRCTWACSVQFRPLPLRSTSVVPDPV